MKRKNHLLFSALGFLMAALLTLCVSLADLPLSEINQHDITRYTQNLHRQEKYIYSLVEQIDPQKNLYASLPFRVSNDVAFFIFKDGKLVHWINDAPIDEQQLLQADTISHFVQLNQNWYITRRFDKDDGYCIVVTVPVKKERVYIDQNLKNNVNAVFSITNSVIIGPPCDDQGITISGVEGYPLINLYTYNQETRRDINLLLRWMSALFLVISVFLLFRYSGRYKTVPLFILLFMFLRAVLFFSGDFLKHKLELFSPRIYADSFFLSSLGDLLLHVIFIFLIVEIIYGHRKIWEIYLTRTTRVKRHCWIAGAIIIIGAFAIMTCHILRSLILHSTINLDIQHPTELNFYSLIAYFILAVLFSTFFLMAHTLLRCGYPTWLNAWKKQTLAVLYMMFISIYTSFAINYYNTQSDQHRNAIWAYKLAMQHDHDNEITPSFALPSNYSYAIYLDAKLAQSGSNFNYRRLGRRWDSDEFTKIFRHNEYIHYAYKISDRYTVIIGHKEDTLINYAAGFSYLFIFFSCLFYSLLHFAGWRLQWMWTNNALRRKITLSLLGLVIFSLVLVCTGSLIYNIAQYKTINSRQIAERIKSTLAILNHELNTLQLDNVRNTPELSTILTRISISFDIDINIYDTQGKLIISSIPEFFSRGMKSARINSNAMLALRKGETSQVIHREKIDQLEYMSVYVSYYNRDGQPCAYIKLPYFINQKEMTDDISTIITSYANVYILIIIIALIISITLSNQITRPLNIIRQNMKSFEQSGRLEPIDYKSPDEVGDLIHSYNAMIVTFNDNNRRLAQAERESAWRDIARQIAHEIKNPLTPMRLSIQHLMRMKQNNAPHWQAHFDEMTHTLLEQIESLSKTAAEFSSFAKLEQQEPATVIDLNAVVKEQLSLFNNYPNITFSIHAKAAPANVEIRRERIHRVLMNILTNAVQAIDKQPHGEIIITLYEHLGRYCVAVEDNGCGVSEEEQEKLFTPNFTTKTCGSGLGLFICRNIIENCGGSINYGPSTLGGACFSICLPKAG
ncbi:MAG: HAMP domain-containing protein [Prevotellaceae bacterium]|jgi:signal transduction histidine kinase|nr:HAMP domain-containing protein [Prevotellaceae bacterium]